MAVDEPQPPYGLSYTSPGPPLFSQPFITASNGQFLGNPFPLKCSLRSTRRIKNPNPLIFRSTFLSRDDCAGSMEHLSLYRKLLLFRPAPIREQYAVQRQLCGFAGASPAGRILRQSRQSGLVPGAQQTQRSGARVASLRAIWRRNAFTLPPPARTIRELAGFGAGLRKRRYDGSIGNSNFNSLQVALCGIRAESTTSWLGYTCSKSIDQASSISDPGTLTTSPPRARFRPSISAKSRRELSSTSCRSTDFGHLQGLTSGWQISGNHAHQQRFPGVAALRRR